MTEIKRLLNERFGFDSFKPGQQATIESILQEEATLSILPTGTGKSLCYQLPSYLLAGATVIVSPLLSLMEDQVEHLKAKGEKQSIAINSQLSFKEKQWALANIFNYKFIFFSPETLLQTEVRQALMGINVSLFVVDEAHCISQWGIDFRPEYEQLQQVIKEIGGPKILALTATATTKVTADIKDKLFDNQVVNEIRHSVDRPNIAYEVVQTSEKLAYLLDYLAEEPGTGIIYFSSKKQAEQTALAINQQTSKRTAVYHGDLTNQERSLIQQQFINDQLDLLCATNAFGMGINKANIRFIIHYHLPASLEAYVQEAGRAGRDGQQSHSVILYQTGDEHLHYFLQQELTREIKLVEELQLVGSKLNKLKQSQLTDLQQKWLTGYQHNNYTLAELEKSLLEKQRNKKQQLSSMLDYLKTSSCRRELILSYFSEQSVNQEQYCCDNCGFHANILARQPAKEEPNSKLLKKWEEILKNLFII